LIKVQEVCLDDGDREDGRGIPDDKGDREEPPNDVIKCIIGVFGEVPNTLSEADKKRLDAVCGTGDHDATDGDKDGGQTGGGDKSADDQTTDPVARKIAFCEANPADPHCEEFLAIFNPDEISVDPSTPHPGGDDGGKDAPSPDFTEGDPIDRDPELKKLCDADPSDSRCDGITGGDSSGAKDDGEDRTDTKDDEGSGSGGTKDDGGSSSGTKDDGGSSTGTKPSGK